MSHFTATPYRLSARYDYANCLREIDGPGLLPDGYAVLARHGTPHRCLIG